MASIKKRETNRQYYLKNKDKIKARSAKYYAENREKVLIKLAEKHKKNPEIMRKRVNDYYHNNPEYKKKTRMYSKKWVSNNSEKRKLYTRNARIRAYGITPEHYQQMLEEQGNCCAICEKENGRAMVIDHCHITGKIRGLLCDGCNLSLGHLEREDFVSKALKYTAKYK